MSDDSWFSSLSNSFSSFADNVSDGFSDFFSVDKTISTDAMTKPDDVIKTKSALSSLGNYDVPDFGITDVPDQGMINGLKNFQADNGLKVDGIMKLGGPTENALGQTLVNQGITNTNLMETAKAQAPKAMGDLPEETTVSATSSFKDNSVKIEQPSLEKHKSIKVDPNTGMVDQLASKSQSKPKVNMKKAWDDFYKHQEKKAKTAVIPQGDTVDKRIRSIMDDERYWKKRDPAITDHVVKQFEKAYPGETQFDETGKMIQPKAVIQPNEVESFDPDGELQASPKENSNVTFIFEPEKETRPDTGSFEYETSDGITEKQSKIGASDEDQKQTQMPTSVKSNSRLKNFPGIDIDFIHEREGNEKELYVPRKNDGSFDGNSGATIGAGVDIGQMNEYDLQRLVDIHGLNPATAEKLKPYLGLTLQEAEEKILSEKKINGGALMFSEAELTNLNNAKYDQIYKTVERLYNRDSKVKFKDLPPRAQTIIASVATQHGAGLDKATPRFWRHITNQDWKSTFSELNNFEDKWSNRRELEAEYLSIIFNN